MSYIEKTIVNMLIELAKANPSEDAKKALTHAASLVHAGKHTESPLPPRAGRVTKEMKIERPFARPVSAEAKAQLKAV